VSDRWPFTKDEVLNSIETDPGDRVLPDGTRLLGRDWGWNNWTVTVMPTRAVGFTTQGFKPSLGKALDAAEAEYYELLRQGWPSLEYYDRVIRERREAENRAAAEPPAPVTHRRWWRP
jgi:hypothetical protein